MIIWNKFKTSLIVRSREFICMEKYDIFINKVQNLLEGSGHTDGEIGTIYRGDGNRTDTKRRVYIKLA